MSRRRGAELPGSVNLQEDVLLLVLDKLVKGLANHNDHVAIVAGGRVGTLVLGGSSAINHGLCKGREGGDVVGAEMLVLLAIGDREAVDLQHERKSHVNVHSKVREGKAMSRQEPSPL